MKRFIFKFWPILFIFAFWFAFAYPFFFQNKVPYSSTYQVNHFFPWSAYPNFHGPVKNGAMPDVTDQIYPWRHFTVETWKNGQIPFWNPYSFSGNPHMANYQSAVFSPFNILFFVFPFVDAWSILVLLAPLLASFFTFLLLREFKVSNAGSLLGAIAFMFCGFMVVWMAYGTLSFSILFLPLVLFAIERWFNKKSKLALALLTLSIPLSFFSGHFQTSLYFLAATFLFLAFKTADNRKNFIPTAVAFLLGVLISLIQIIPSIQLYLESARSGIFTSHGGIPLFYLVNIFAPDFFGNPVTRNDWFGYYAEWAGFVGIIPLILSFVAFSKKNKIVLFFSILSLITLILAVDSPLQKAIVDLKIPVVSTSNTSRIIVLLSFSLAVLSGFGFDRLKNLIAKGSRNSIFKIILGGASLLGLIWLSLISLNLMPDDKEIIAQRNLILPSVIFTAFSLITFLGFLRKKELLLFAILFLVAFDSLRFAQKWMPFDPKELVFPETPVISAIRENIGFGRIFGNFRANMDTYYGFPSVEGQDPLYIERYGEFIRAASNGEIMNAERSVAQLSRRGEFTDRVLDLLGVSLIFHPVEDTNKGWAYPVWEDKDRFVSIYNDGRLELYRNNSALERAKLFYSYEVITEKEDLIKRFYSEDFDFRNVLILEEDPNLPVFTERPQGGAEITEYEPNKVIIQVTSQVPGMLFLSDNFYPGWKAKINGKEAKIYRADYSFRAVVVPGGESLVEFSYKPL